jgi:hypothetical protein
LLIGGAVALAYGVASAAAPDPRAAVDRAGVAAVVSLHFAGVSLVRPWSTAIALALIVMVGTLVAALSRTAAEPVAAAYLLAGPDADPADPRYLSAPGALGVSAPSGGPGAGRSTLALDDTGMPRHRAQIGGAATLGVLLAMPGVFAAVAADQGRSAQIVLTAALAASSLGLAALAVVGRWVAQYLPWATVGLVGGATITALASLPTSYPTALYAAAAALLGVIAEMLRGATPAPGLTVAPVRDWAGGGYRRPRWTEIRPSGLRGRWLVDPATGAVAVAIVPSILALISIAPALKAALLDPLEQTRHIWDGPIAALSQPQSGNVDGTSVLAIVLLTGAAALAAIGCGLLTGTEAVASQWRGRVVYEPAIGDDEADTLYSGWLEAVERALPARVA